MNARMNRIAAALVGAVLVGGLLFAACSDDDGSMGGMGGMSSSGNPQMGMMQAFGDMDSDAMLDRMREMLGEDGYRQMLQHFADHSANRASMMNSSSIDSMMHQMMDGMLQQMPDDSGHRMPMFRTPTPSSR